MTREKIISLARPYGIYELTEDAIIAFYHKAQAEAFEAAAKLAEEVYDRLAYDTALDAAVAIREMAKEKQNG